MGARATDGPPIALAALPLVIVVAVNLLMSLFVLPRMDASFLPSKNGARPRSPRSAACGRW